MRINKSSLLLLLLLLSPLLLFSGSPITHPISLSLPFLFILLIFVLPLLIARHTLNSLDARTIPLRLTPIPRHFHLLTITSKLIMTLVITWNYLKWLHLKHNHRFLAMPTIPSASFRHQDDDTYDYHCEGEIGMSYYFLVGVRLRWRLEGGVKLLGLAWWNSHHG